MFKKFRDFLQNIHGYADSYAQDNCTFLSQLPFQYMECVLTNWKVEKKETDNNEKYWEDSCNNDEFVICDEQTARVRTYYSYWKHHKFYSNTNSQKTGGKKPFIDNYIETVVAFLKNGELNKALTIIDIVYVLVERALIHKDNCRVKPTEKEERYLKRSKSALHLLSEFLETDKAFLNQVRNPSQTSGYFVDITKPMIHKIDGSMALAREIGVDNFIQYAIEQCYFFDQDDVYRRMNYICTCFSNEWYLHARKSNSESIQIDDKMELNDFMTKIEKQNNERKNHEGIGILSVNKKTKHRLFSDSEDNIEKYPIIVDTDGNEDLRSIISSITGFTVAAGKDSVFQNYKISHIWGKAYDPRYFTNLWNVVLVPAWANDLLDKQNADEGSLESRLKSTIMRICEVLYFCKITNWEDLCLSRPLVYNPNDKFILQTKKIIPDSIEVFSDSSSKIGSVPYLINVIKMNDENAGIIDQYAVSI